MSGSTPKPSSTIWESFRIRYGNVVVRPINDALLHSASQSCICQPKWEAHYHPGQGVAGWIFTHNALDDRE